MSVDKFQIESKKMKAIKTTVKFKLILFTLLFSCQLLSEIQKDSA